MFSLRAALFSLLILALCAAPPARAQELAYAGVDVRDLATRHYYNPFDGLMLDRNPYPSELVDDAEQLVAHLAAGGGDALGIGAISSARAMAWTPGHLEIVAIGLASGRPRLRRATFDTNARVYSGARDVPFTAATLTVSLADLTLALRTPDGAFALVDPVGAGGYLDQDRGTLMTPAMRPDVTRTPGRAWLPRARYPNYMIRSRTTPDYYEGLPFVRLRRFDQATDEYGLHGPISRSGTFPLPPNTPGEALAKLRRLAPRLSGDPEALADQLIADGLVDPDTRLVRGRISNGCIRLRARDIRELFPLLDALPDGAPVTVTYASDPGGAAHPFPWETSRFAIATDEKDEDGLTVMFTGQLKNRPGQGRERLPYPGDEDLRALDDAAARSARALTASRRPPRDWLAARHLEMSFRTSGTPATTAALR